MLHIIGESIVAITVMVDCLEDGYSISREV